jgi:hypothetical protein
MKENMIFDLYCRIGFLGLALCFFSGIISAVLGGNWGKVWKVKGYTYLIKT